MSSFLDHIPTLRRIPGKLWQLSRPLLLRLWGILRILSSRRVVTRVSFVCACLLTLTVIFYSVERWRWRAAWDDYAIQARQGGVRLEATDFPARAPMLESENFAAIPYFRDYYRKPEPPDGLTGPVFDALVGGVYEFEPSDKTTASERLRAAVAKPNTILSGAARESTADTAKAVLQLLDVECGTVSRQLHQAVDRPFARFPDDSPSRFRDLGRPWIRMRKAFQLEASRLRLHAAAKDGAAALDDLRVCLRVADISKSEPAIISAMIRVAIVQASMESIRTGLGEQIWDDSTLARIDGLLSEIDLVATYHFGIETERIYVNEMFREFAAGRFEFLDGFWKPAKRNLIRYAPIGWIYRNQVKVNQYIDQAAAKADLKNRTLSCDFSKEEQQVMSASKVQDMLYRTTVPAILRVASRTAASEALVRQARTACALERYRLKNGSYPEQLNILVTAGLLSELPRDPINNVLMEYQRTEDVRYFLKSTKTVRVSRDVAPWPEAWTPAAGS